MDKISNFRPISENWEDFLENDAFSDFQKIGEAELSDTDELLVFSCKSNKNLNIRSSKKEQFEIAKKALKEDFKDGAIFVFYDDAGNFRFSFIRKNYGDKTQKYSTWKRFTYFVESEKPNKTFLKRVGDCSFLNLDAIQNAFSVEPLNEEFYKKIVRSFYSLVGGEVGSGRNIERLPISINLPGNRTQDRNAIRQFGVRLIGRLIFCWFLKIKTSENGVPLIPDGWIGTKSLIPDYYHSLLEKLFFEVLNQKSGERKALLPENHKLIPFLNGGLFEPQNGEDSDFYGNGPQVEQRSNYGLSIPDQWFVELYETLEQYNFTIDENSVNDAEVSIDPEMLGRIFENLLAEIDPNLEDSEKKSVRKATGSFYTPREIVDYMVEEALVKYLHNKTSISEKLLHPLFKEGNEFGLDDKQSKAVLNAFDEVKILDPACGSGAFPMGALHKIVLALQKIDPDAEQWKNKQLAKITNAAIRSDLKQRLDKASSEYRRKLGVIQNSIFGADIQPIAAEISKLRSFLSLIVDENIEDDKPNRGVLELPNLEFKFVTANTLIQLESSGIESPLIADKIPELQEIRQDYLQAHGDEKLKLKKRFKDVQYEIKIDQAKFDGNPNTRANQLADWDPFTHHETPWFDPNWMYGVEQFDIILGNPPYGGTKISDALKTRLGLASKDPYGAFIAKFLGRRRRPTHLAHGGILAYIVSDTFMTIKSHKELRDLMLENRLHSMVRVHSDTFKATVNTAIVLAERLEEDKADSKPILMADFTNTSIHAAHDRFEQLMSRVVQYVQPEYTTESLESDGTLYMKGSDWTSESNPEYAIYTYPQSLILTNTNHPFFVASPKLFGLMNDTNSTRIEKTIDGKIVNAREIKLNDKIIEIVKLGEIADVKVGLQTGDNEAYLFQNPEARGNYRSINDFSEFLLKDADLEKIRNNETLRLAVIDEGISKDNPVSERYFGGRYIVPYDKGGESDSNEGWMPNYYVKPQYFLNWCEEYAITLNNENLLRPKSTKPYVRNKTFYFKKGISFSDTGEYSPTYRLGFQSIFDQKGSNIVLENDSILEEVLLILPSKNIKFFVRAFINHTVSSHADNQKDILIVINKKQTKHFIHSICSRQKQSPQYDYASHEQLEIDALVYQAYGLNWADIREVENWYERRYGKLVAAQKRNLEALGKPTDYLEIYKGILGEEM